MKFKYNYIYLFLFFFGLLFFNIYGSSTLSAADTVTIDGIRYSLMSDKKSYAVTDYDDSSTYVEIEEYINELPVTDIGFNVFYNTKIETVIMPNTIEVISSNAFVSAAKLKKVVLSKSLKFIGSRAFYRCTSLEEVNIPYSLMSIGTQAFAQCLKLKKIEFLNKNIRIASEAFSSCIELEYVSIPNDISYLGEYAFLNTLWDQNLPVGPIYFGNYLYKYNGLIKEGETVQIKNGTRVIGNYAFSDQINLRQITIPASVVDIGYKTFENCINLTDIILLKE